MDTFGGNDKTKWYYIIGAILSIVVIAWYMWYMGYITMASLSSMPSMTKSNFADLGDGTVPLIGGLVGRYDQTTTPQLAPYVQQQRTTDRTTGLRQCHSELGVDILLRRGLQRNHRIR